MTSFTDPVVYLINHFKGEKCSVYIYLICSIFDLPLLPAEKKINTVQVYIFSVDSFFYIRLIITWTTDFSQ